MTENRPPQDEQKQRTRLSASNRSRPRITSSHGNQVKDPPRPVDSPPPEEKRPVPVPHRTGPRRASPTDAPSTQAVETAIAVARAALDKKAANVDIINLVGKTDYTDYLVLMSGNSERHVRALADHIQRELRKTKIKPLSIEGLEASTWVLLDYGDVVVHVFQEQTRAVYDLDGLWLDASRVPVPHTPSDAESADQ